MFWRQFLAKKELRTEFLTSFSLLTIRANWKQNNSCEVWFEANLETQESCARRFSQPLASQQYGLIWSKTTVAQSVLTPISSKKSFRTEFLTTFSFLTIRANLRENESSAVWLEANFEQQHGCSRCFLQILSKTANKSFLDITVHLHQLRKIFSCAPSFTQAIGQRVRTFCQVV